MDKPTEQNESSLVAQWVTKLMQADDLNERAAATRILKTIFSNIVNNPNEPKYRKVKIGPGLGKLTSLDGGKQIMAACGWVVSGEQMELKPEHGVQLLREALAWTEYFEKEPTASFSCAWCRKRFPKKDYLNIHLDKQLCPPCFEPEKQRQNRISETKSQPPSDFKAPTVAGTQANQPDREVSFRLRKAIEEVEILEEPESPEELNDHQKEIHERKDFLRQSKTFVEGAHEEWLWRTRAFAGQFCDPFLRETSLDRGGDTAEATQTMLRVINRFLAHPHLLRRDLSSIASDPAKLQGVREIFKMLQASNELIADNRVQVSTQANLNQQKNEDTSHLVPLLDSLMKKLHALPKGGRMIIHGGWSDLEGGHAVMYIVDRDAEDNWGFVVVNTGEGINYHPGTWDTYPKQKVRVAIRVAPIHASKILDPSVWYMLCKLKFTVSEHNTMENLYEVILPHLAGTTIRQVIEKEAKAGRCGDFETAQRSGTCYFWCVLGTIRYLGAQMVGLDKRQRKQLIYALRLAFLHEIRDEMDILKEAYESDLLTNPKSGSLKFAVQSRWHETDKTMVSIACQQTCLAGIKLQKLKGLSKNGLVRLASLTETIENKTLELDALAKREGNSLIHGQNDQIVKFTSLSDKYEHFSGFGYIKEEDTEKYAGYETDAPPDLFMDLTDPSTNITSLQELIQLFQTTVARCNSLRSKTSISAVSLSMFQTVTLIEHIFSSSWFPFPSPWKVAPNVDCLWQSASITQQDQREGLKELFLISQHYLAALFSLQSDPVLYANRVMIHSTILACFDSLIRIKPTDGISPLTKTLNGEGDGEEDFKGYAIELVFFNKQLLSRMTEHMVFVNPAIMALRSKVLDYWDSSHQVEANRKPIFSWTNALSVKSTVIPLVAATPDAEFIAALLKNMGITKEFPWQVMDDWNERTDLGVQETTRSKTEMERFGLWFAALTAENPKFCPEFAQYRDLVLLTKLLMSPTLESKNPTLFVPNTLWFTGQLKPTWEPSRGRSETEVWLFLRLFKKQILVAADGQISPAHPICFFNPPKLPQKRLTEDDVLVQEELQTFDESLSQEDSEKLASILTSPCLALPLVLQFFVENRIGTLLNLDIRCVLEHLFFSPGKYNPIRPQISVVPLPEGYHLGTLHGWLRNEVSQTPDAIFEPLFKLLKEAETMCFSDYHSVFVSLYLFLIRFAIRVINFRNYAQSVTTEPIADSELLAPVCNYLTGQAKTLLSDWLEDAQDANQQDNIMQLQCHLSFVHLLGGSVPDFLKSTTHIILWHGKQSFIEKQRKCLYANHYLGSVPIHDVFANYHASRNRVLDFVSSSKLDVIEPLLQEVADIGIGQLTSDVSTGWEKIESKPPMCVAMVESDHIYRGPIRFYASVSFPGAEHISICFDSLSKIGVTDYVTIYQDNTYTTTWGPSKIQNNWPGASGRPPLVIPSDHFVVFFYADATTLPDWGFRLTATAPVCLQSVEVLYHDLAKTEKAPTRLMCQHALAAANNNVEEARQLLLTDQDKLSSLVAKDDQNQLAGLYSKTSPSGTVHVNLQTAEVYCGNRLSMPVPLDIASHLDFKQVFKNKVPYCTVKETKQFLKTLQIEDEDDVYYVYSWSPIKFQSHEEDAVSKIEKEKQSAAVSEKAGAPYINSPMIQKTDGGLDILEYRNVIWNPYQRGEKGWLSAIFDSSLDENLVGSDLPKIWARDDDQNHILAQLVMFVPPSGDDNFSNGNPGMFYEIRGNAEFQNFEVYAILEEGRQAQTSLVYASDCYFSFGKLKQREQIKQRVHPKTERAGGNMFRFLFDWQGTLVKRPGCGSLFDANVSSVLVKRQKKKALITDWELFIPQRVLKGLLPEILLKQYEFWKAGDTIRGYPVAPDEWSNYELVVNVKDDRAFIYRKNQTETMHLMNVLAATKDSVLGRLAGLFSKVDRLANVLFWSKSHPQRGDEAEITLIELPVIKARFQISSGPNGDVQLSSLDHNGLFVSENQNHQWVTQLPHSLVLENNLKERFVLMPNYEMKSLKIKSSPFSTTIITLQSKEWSASVRTRFYLYPIHLSGLFLKTETLSSALYLICVLLLRRDYDMIAKVISSAHSDTSLTDEEKWILGMVTQTVQAGPDNEVDVHPNAHACRLRLALVAIESGAKDVPWRRDLVQADLIGYIAKYSHLSNLCRLTTDEEDQIITWLESESFQVRQRYIRTIKEVLAGPPGGSKHMLMFPVVPQNGGQKVFDELYQPAAQSAFQTIDRFYDFGYSRPENTDPIHSIELLRLFWTDDINGKFWKTGWPLIYDILTGRLNLNLTTQTQSVEQYFPDKLNSASEVVKSIEMREGIRNRITQSNLNLAKLLLHAAILKCTAKNRQLKRTERIWLSVLTTVLVTAEVDNNNWGKTSHNFLFPSLPIKDTDLILSENVHISRLEQDPEAYAILHKFLAEVGAASQKVLTEPYWLSHEFQSKTAAMTTRPSTLVIDQKSLMTSTPVVKDTGRDRHVLTPFSIPGTTLSLSKQQLEVFTGRPLVELFQEYIEFVHIPEQCVPALPWEDKLKAHSVSKTKFSSDTLTRLNQEMAEAAQKAANSTTPQLTFLGPQLFDGLHQEVEVLEQRVHQSLRESGGFGFSDLRTSHDSLRSSLRASNDGLRQSVSAKKSMKGAILNLEAIHHRLTTLQNADAEILRSAFEELETLANDIGPNDNTAQLLYRLKQKVGIESSFWAEILSCLLLSTTPFEDLRRTNPFISEDQTDKILSAVAHVLMRSVQLTHINRCLSDVVQLLARMKEYLVHELEIRELKASSKAFKSSNAMLNHALLTQQYDVKKAGMQLVDMHNKIVQLVKENSNILKDLNADEQYAVVFFMFHVAKFNVEATEDLIRNNQPSHLLSLANRGCYWNQKPFVIPQKNIEESSNDKNKLMKLKAMIHVLRFRSSNLAYELSAKRCYMTQTEQGFEYDPRFLVFEFAASLFLRKRQIEIVHEFVKTAKTPNASTVHQMIMGAGKTSVICPLLTLMLANGKSLVTQVVLESLLYQSRDIMRSVFSRIIRKRCYTLTFDRSSPHDYLSLDILFKKLERARRECAIVCTTPSAIKSLMLKYVDMLNSVLNADRLLLLPENVLKNSQVYSGLKNNATILHQYEWMADRLSAIISLWGPSEGGIALLDEVDQILHPLKSELNFPIGPKLPLSLLPERYELPIHLLDAVLKHNQSIGQTRTDHKEALILNSIHQKIKEGIKVKAIQENPHPVLLQEAFYFQQLIQPFAEWSLLWLLQQNSVDQALKRAKADNVDTFKEAVQYLTSFKVTDTLVNPKYFEPTAIKLFNLSRSWLLNFLPHCLSKINRVTYGLLQLDDLERYETRTGEDRTSIPLSRRLLAVPFEGKDRATTSSEFAHPEVLVGLSFFAYRYEGLRSFDVVTIVKKLKDDLLFEPGATVERPTWLMFNDWLSAAATVHGEDKRSEIYPLDLLLPEDIDQINKLTTLLGKIPSVIHYYLREIVYDSVLHNQELKLVASGHDLGSDMLFNTRLGFSGTPSNILPNQLLPCHFEPGSEAKIINTLRDSSVVSLEVVVQSSATELLNYIANQPFGALIDCGALITGYNNEEVARYLLAAGLKDKDGCVFLNASSEKMVLDRSGLPPVPLNRSGLSVDKRFAFYDQVHTIGTDIKHSIDAVAVVTLGKDMTFRDFKQGCWRMRDIAQGQTIHVLVIPEILQLIRNITQCGSVPSLDDICCWLMWNSLESEQMQYTQLIEQDVSYVWRKQAMQALLASTAMCEPGTGLNAPFFQSRFDEPVTSQSQIKLILEQEDKRINTSRLATTQKTEANEDFKTCPFINVVQFLAANLPPTHDLSPIMEQMAEVIRTEGEDIIGDEHQLYFRFIAFQRKEEMKQAAATKPADTGAQTLTSATTAQSKTWGLFEPNQKHLPVADRQRLKQSLQTFCVPFGFSISDSLPTTKSTQKLEDLILSNKEFLNPASQKEIETIMKHLIEEKQNTDVGAHSNEWDSEIVQEQEEEREQHREKQKDDRIFQMNKLPLAHWEITTLLEDIQSNAVAIVKAFYPLSDFQVSPLSPTLSFPESLLMSGNHTSFLAPMDGLRRLKNIHCLLMVTGEDQLLHTIILSLHEAEVVRFAINSKQISPDRFAICTQSGFWLTPHPSNMSIYETNLTLAKFFNSEIHFSERETQNEVISLLQSLQATPKENRKAFFEATIRCRRRLLVGWEKAPVASVFSYDDPAQLKKFSEMSEKVKERLRTVIVGYQSLLDYFKQQLPDNEEFLPSATLKNIFIDLKVDLTPDQMDELLSQVSSSNPGFISHADFASYFYVVPPSKMVQYKKPAKVARKKKTALTMRPTQQKTRAEITDQKHATRVNFRGVQFIGQIELISGTDVVVGADNVISTCEKGYPSIAPNYVMLSKGSWYFEVTVLTNGKCAIGWADELFKGDSARGIGVGDCDNSWAYDFKQLKGNNQNAEGKKQIESWNIEIGDTVSVFIDLNGKAISFSLNSGPIVLAFKNLEPNGSVSPAMSLSCKSKLRVNLGEFPVQPRAGFVTVNTWVRKCIQHVYALSNKQMLGQLIAIDGSAHCTIRDMTWWTDADRGFPSVGVCGVLINSGKWYYKVKIISPGNVAQIGWCDFAFRPELSDSWGVGDDRHSY